MKVFLIYLLSLSLVLVFLPAVIAGGWWDQEKNMDMPDVPEETAAGEETGPDGDMLLKIYIVQAGTLREIELEDYVRGVVAAEMPASFHPEALKAQAVAARTYARQKAGAGGGGCPGHPGASLCTDSSCCQAWLDNREAREKWPSGEANSYLARIAEAVRSTRGQVLTFNGELIHAVYHSTCGGRTEAAAELWNSSGGGSSANYPYLQSVECPYCRNSPAYHQELAMEVGAYTAALQGEKEALPVLAEGSRPLLEVVEKSSSGRNLLLRLGRPGRLYSGTELRNLLGLPSTHFSWRVEEGKIIFSVRGNGHGVGMCQYGANGLALAGKNYTEILNYYYRDAVLENLADRPGPIEENVYH